MECNRKVCFKELIDKTPIRSSSCNRDCLISFDDRKNISISDKNISIGFLGSEDDEAELLKKLISNDIKLSSFETLRRYL